MAEIISGIYKITNTITGDCYIGSSKNIKQRWAVHKCKSTWNEHPSNPMYQDMMKYSVDKFELEILAEVEPEKLKETEQQFIETLKPTYNDRNANGLDIEKLREYQIEYYQQNREKRKEYQNKYNSQLCCYNGETLTLNALRQQFRKSGVAHSTAEARKYLLNK